MSDFAPSIPHSEQFWMMWALDKKNKQTNSKMQQMQFDPIWLVRTLQLEKGGSAE